MKMPAKPRPLFIGLLLGFALGLLPLLFRQPEEKVKVLTQVKFRTRTVEKEVVKWKTKEVVKYKTRTVYKSDGTKIVETCSIGTKEKAGSKESHSDKVSELEEKTIIEASKPALTKYSVGFSANPLDAATTPHDLSLYTVSGGVRIGDWPLFLTGSINGELEWRLGLRYEF